MRKTLEMRRGFTHHRWKKNSCDYDNWICGRALAKRWDVGDLLKIRVVISDKEEKDSVFYVVNGALNDECVIALATEEHAISLYPNLWKWMREFNDGCGFLSFEEV